jgi:hypothetical protein
VAVDENIKMLISTSVCRVFAVSEDEKGKGAKLKRGSHSSVATTLTAATGKSKPATSGDASEGGAEGKATSAVGSVAGSATVSVSAESKDKSEVTAVQKGDSSEEEDEDEDENPEEKGEKKDSDPAEGKGRFSFSFGKLFVGFVEFKLFARLEQKCYCCVYFVVFFSLLLNALCISPFAFLLLVRRPQLKRIQQPFLDQPFAKPRPRDAAQLLPALRQRRRRCGVYHDHCRHDHLLQGAEHRQSTGGQTETQRDTHTAGAARLAAGRGAGGWAAGR